MWKGDVEAPSEAEHSSPTERAFVEAVCGRAPAKRGYVAGKPIMVVETWLARMAGGQRMSPTRFSRRYRAEPDPPRLGRDRLSACLALTPSVLAPSTRWIRWSRGRRKTSVESHWTPFHQPLRSRGV
jgi:hypothetical protein